MTRAVVSGFGIVAPNGSTVEEFWQSVVSSTTVVSEASSAPGSGIKVAEVRGGVFREELPVMAKNCDRNAQFAVAAAGQALASANLRGGFERPDRVAVILGNGAGGQTSIDEQYLRQYGQGKPPHPMTIQRAMGSSSASLVSMTYGACGPCFVVSSACASSNHAIGLALQFLRGGLADIVVTGGTEACLNLGSLLAWKSMRILANGPCRPFSRGRDGLLLAEGAGILVMEAEEHARSRGVHCTVELAGFGSTSDARDPLLPSVDGMSAAMRGALADAGLRPDAIAYINAHGTGTMANDKAETSAIKMVFNDSGCPPLSSTKSITGHALGASGAFEAIATVLAIQHSLAPATANFEAFDPDCDLDCIPNVARPMSIPAALSNSFAFGGLNACLVLRGLT